MTPSFDKYARSYESLHKQSIALSGEEPDYFARYKAQWLLDWSRREGEEPGVILDFGCGIGGLIQSLNDAFPRATYLGRDVSEESVRLAKELHPELDLQTIRESDMHIAPESVDLAVAACVFHHIEPAVRDSALEDIARTIRPGGSIHIFEHNPRNPLTLKVVRECEFDEDAILLRAEETMQRLTDAGFENVRCEYIVFFPKFAGFLRRFERRLKALPIGAQYVVTARKPSAGDAAR